MFWEISFWLLAVLIIVPFLFKIYGYITSTCRRTGFPAAPNLPQSAALLGIDDELQASFTHSIRPCSWYVFGAGLRRKLYITWFRAKHCCLCRRRLTSEIHWQYR